ncbi:hypothetical protein KFL_001350130 [Klebsormidium nitens]|uniref:Uncharacterized protein n=1 Tax=Klebsormidium nitens TaxID=105231 RepID=A0A1Y1I4P5_KLENI|nr:hypothetical protein KFL_001350130 [Klebsormidium nitens]|eukprot:GAQ83088.1 hypothetical protein KFL_001350130 [Klebsormidium nitens]
MHGSDEAKALRREALSCGTCGPHAQTAAIVSTRFLVPAAKSPVLRHWHYSTLHRLSRAAHTTSARFQQQRRLG